MNTFSKRAYWLLAMLQIAACHFENAGKQSAATVNPSNMCSSNADCSAGSSCRDGICVAKSADAPLSIALQITPQRALASADPLPVIIDRFVLQAPDTRSFEVPASVPVSGKIRNASAAIEAQLSFTPVSVIPGVAPKTVVTSVVPPPIPPLIDPKVDYSVQLLSGVRYRMLVKPKMPAAGDQEGSALPPYQRIFKAGAETTQSVEFQDVPDEQVFRVSGLPAGVGFLLSALDAQTGETVSSTAVLAHDGMVPLRFMPDAPAFRLQIRAAQSYAEAAPATQVDCDMSTPTFATLTIDQKDLVADADGVMLVALPVQPERIPYEGTVDLCATEQGRVASVSKLSVTLHARALLSTEQSPWRAAFDASTDANFDNGTKKLRFCALVMPGEYDIVATPPLGMECALFAERRLIQAPDAAATNASGTVLQLPATGHLSGTLQTPSGMTIQGATVEATALGLSSEAAANDASVTRYNRSQQTTTDAAGKFKLPVDPGTYDVIFKPPASSGFPWQARTGVVIGPRPVDFANTVELPSPVSLSGTLVQGPRNVGAAAASLQSAQVEAYAVIPDADTGERAVLLGKTTADENGHFVLLLPPGTVSEW